MMSDATSAKIPSTLGESGRTLENMALMNVEVMEFSLSLVEEGHINLSNASVMIKSQGVGRLLRRQGWLETSHEVS